MEEDFKQKEMQRKYFQMQLSKEQLSGLLGEKQVIEERIEELMNTMTALDKIKDVKKGQEIWSPVGSGSFIQADIKNVKDAVIGIGAGVVVKKNIDDAREILKGRLDVMVDLDNQFTTQINRLVKQIEKTEQELQSMMQKKEEGIGG